MLELFAVTTRGIESICAEEMMHLPGLHRLNVQYRRVHATYSGPIAPLLHLRTVDDLFILLATWHDIGSHRSTLAQLEELARDLDPWHAYSIRTALFPSELAAAASVPTFAVTANFVGRRNYTAEEIKLALARGLASATAWHYANDDGESEINVRVFIEHEDALVGMRLGRAPLGKRAYKQEHLPGSLKPTVASAMLQWAGIAPGETLLDPCCGAGTILVEGATWGAHASGGDQEPSAVAAAQRNAKAADVAISVQAWDVRNLPLSAASVDCIVSNLPWGRQVVPDSALVDFYAQTCAEMERVLRPAGRIVILTSHAELVTFGTLAIRERREISLFGQQPSLLRIDSA